MGDIYQQKRLKGHHISDHAKFMETLWFVRGHKNRVKKLDELTRSIDSLAQNSDGMPHGTSHGDPTANKAVQIAQLKSEIDVVEKALLRVPVEYREEVFKHAHDCLVYTHSTFDKAHTNTWKKWLQVFILNVAALRDSNCYLDSFGKER